MVTLALKTRGDYSKVVSFPSFLRKMMGWHSNTQELDVVINGSSITLTPVAIVENAHDKKKIVKLEKKKRA